MHRRRQLTCSLAHFPGERQGGWGPSWGSSPGPAEGQRPEAQTQLWSSRMGFPKGPGLCSVMVLECVDAASGLSSRVGVCPLLGRPVGCGAPQGLLVLESRSCSSESQIGPAGLYFPGQTAPHPSKARPHPTKFQGPWGAPPTRGNSVVGVAEVASHPGCRLRRLHPEEVWPGRQRCRHHQGRGPEDSQVLIPELLS